jgi:hypothetical protein
LNWQSDRPHSSFLLDSFPIFLTGVKTVIMDFALWNAKKKHGWSTYFKNVNYIIKEKIWTIFLTSKKITWLKFTPHYFSFTKIFLCIIIEIGFARNQHNRTQWRLSLSLSAFNKKINKLGKGA